MGEVWLARESASPNRRGVVKRILPEIAVQDRSIAMFRAEAWLCSRLRHGGIVQLLEAGEDPGGAPYLVLEHVEGTDLQVLLATLSAFDVRLHPVVAAHVARAVLFALAYVHELTDEGGAPLGIVHRDISPANILLSSAGEVKLCDFGVAKMLARQTSGRFLKGKVRYMSPEQVNGGTVEARSDQFSVGAVLWEMLTGTPRFQGSSVRDTLEAVAGGGLPDGAGIDAPDATGLLAILARALSPEPSARFPYAGDFATALEDWMVGVGARAPEPSLRAVVAWSRDPGLEPPEAALAGDPTAVDRPRG
jgi:serine/threonine protein kinase